MLKLKDTYMLPPPHMGVLREEEEQMRYWGEGFLDVSVLGCK